MFADIVKIAANTALIAVITAAIIAIFVNVQIPDLDFTLMGQALGKGLAIIYHWVPGSNIIVPIAFGMMGVQLAILLFEYAMIAVRWVMKVNE